MSLSPKELKTEFVYYYEKKVLRIKPTLLELTYYFDFDKLVLVNTTPEAYFSTHANTPSKLQEKLTRRTLPVNYACKPPRLSSPHF